MTLPGARLLLYLAFALLTLPRLAAAQAFGRFGRIHEDGLLTVNVNPRGFSLPATSTNLTVKWGDPQAPLSAIVPKIDPTEKRLEITGGGDGAPTAIRYTLLYPGVVAQFGKRMVLRFEGRDGKPLRCGLDATRLKTIGLLLLPGDRFPTTPILVIPPRRPDLKVWFNGISLTVEGSEPIGEVRLATPTGIARVESLAGAWTAARQIADLPVPARTGVKSALAADRASVTVTEGFRGGIAPVSPVLAFAIEKGYPAQVDGTLVRTLALTRWGPYAYVRGGSARVTLPVPSNEARGYVRPAEPDPRRMKQLNALVGHLGGSWAKNAVDLGFAGMANAQLAGPLLTPENRKLLLAAWKKHLARAFVVKEPTWHVETEPITGEGYVWTYKIDGPGGFRYDIDWGNALPLYGLATYARYTGDWALVRKSAPSIQRIRRYFELADDWVWMTAANADHGYSTGTGDPLCAVYAAAVACRDMAQALGDTKGELRAAVWAARAAVPTVARFWYTDFARASGQIGPASLVLGFQETEGFTRCVPGRDDPWNATTLLSGDGCLPELMELYRRTAPDAVQSFEDAYEAAFPRWFDGGVGYPFATTYKGNSLYVTLPHLYARSAVLGEGPGKLWPRVDRALSNRDNGWIGPNVLAELVARPSPMVLTGWGTARYDDGSVAADGKSVTLRFVVRKGPWRLSARLADGVAVAGVRGGGVDAKFSVVEGRLSASGVAPSGPLEVVVALAEPSERAPAPALTPQGRRDKVR